MKKLFALYSLVLACLLITACSNSPSHERKNIWVLDNENDLTTRQISNLDSLYKLHEKKTTNEISLITTPNFEGDSTIELFTKHLWDKYGFGKKGKNNGVVIVFSSLERQTRIGTGLGLEKILTNEMTQKIIDSVMIPRFKSYHYFDGLWEGSKAIIDFLEKPENKIK